MAAQFSRARGRERIGAGDPINLESGANRGTAGKGFPVHSSVCLEKYAEEEQT